MSQYLAKTETLPTTFIEKLRMGMSLQDYTRSLITPFNVIAAIILSIGLPVIAIRFVQGLAFATHASNEYPWGLLLGWGLFGGVPLSATGFVMATAYYIFGYKDYAPLVRLGVLIGLLGYFFAATYLMIDLGRPWRIYYPMVMGFGTASVLFLVAWHVSTYLTVQILEFSPVILEWLKSKRVRRWALRITVAMTIAGIILSTLHQSALGAMFLLAPGKLHPLWYSTYLPILNLVSSIYAALVMVIAVSTLCARYLSHRADETFLGSLDRLTLGLGKGAVFGMYVYFSLKLIALAHDDNWALLNTPYGHWFLVELLGFVVLPIFVLSYGIKHGRVGIVRFGAFFAVLGVLMNRINISIVAFNWNLPNHLHHIVPPWQEFAMVAAVVTLHILVFRWIVNRMPVIRQDASYQEQH